MNMFFYILLLQCYIKIVFKSFNLKINNKNKQRTNFYHYETTFKHNISGNFLVLAKKIPEVL